jgi:HSP20 family protein
VDNGLLTIAGEKKVEAVRSAEEYDGVRMYECRYGRFERRLTLPQYVDADKVSAHYNNGVLKLVLPKLAQSRRKTIEIGTSEERPRQLETGDRSRKTT